MDGRYVVLGLVIVALGVACDAVGATRQAWGWSVPFALMAFFLGAVSTSPAGRWREFAPEPDITKRRPPKGA